MLLRLFTLVVDVGVAVWRSTAGLRWSGTLASETALAVRLYTTVARLKAVGLPDPPRGKNDIHPARYRRRASSWGRRSATRLV
jgi:hypothetical protein